MVNQKADIIAAYGYHGTTSDAVESILERGFIPSKNGWDWLGKGIYFWQDAPNRAAEWAKLKAQENKAAPVVLKCTIALDESCIDLLDIGWFDLVSDVSDAYFAAAKNNGIDLCGQEGINPHFPSDRTI
jgi:hypothetical protein